MEKIQKNNHWQVFIEKKIQILINSETPGVH